jgi:putative two-component system response regulator
VRPRVLVVDDHPANLDAVKVCLAELECEIETAQSGADALGIVASSELSLVLLDVRMPGMSGYAVCRRIKSLPLGALLPVVMLTALNDTSDRVKALDAGADDFLSKPFSRVELIARVRSALRLKEVYDTLDSAEQVIFALAAAVEAKDAYTEKHTRRVADAARRLGLRLGLTGPEVDALFRGGLVHDVGKIGVPDAILSKPGQLGSDEWERMQEHAAIGETILRPLRSARPLLPIIRHHHERVDGGGYPDGLRGEEIPLLARIVAVCDAFDALVSDRPYRAGLSTRQALDRLEEGGGSQWDPELVQLMQTLVPSMPGYWAA